MKFCSHHLRESFQLVTFVAGPLSTQLLTSDEPLLSLSLFFIKLCLYVSIMKWILDACGRLLKTVAANSPSVLGTPTKAWRESYYLSHALYLAIL